MQSGSTCDLRVVMLTRETSASCFLAHRIDSLECCTLAAIISESSFQGKAELLRKKLTAAVAKKGIWAAASLLLQTPYLFWRDKKATARQKKTWGAELTGKFPTDVRHHATDNLNSDATVTLLRRFDADLLFVFGTRILESRVFRSSKLGAVNLHAGITPEYRGAKSEFWALLHGESNMVGFTLHRIDQGVDTGDVLFQGKIEVFPDDDDITLRIRNIETAANILGDVFLKIATGEQEVMSITGRRSQLHSTPTMWQYLKLKFCRKFRG